MLLKKLYSYFFLINLFLFLGSKYIYSEQSSIKTNPENTPDAFEVLSAVLKSDKLVLSSLSYQDLKNFSGFSEFDNERFTFQVLDILPIPKITSELRCMAEAIYFEARGEDIEGQFAVGEVIINRVISQSFPNSICRVVSEGSGRLNSCQFSYNCDGKLEVINEKVIYNRILKLSRILLEPSARVLTNGATFYHSKAVSPTWSKTFKKTKEIGNHVFYKLP